MSSSCGVGHDDGMHPVLGEIVGWEFLLVIAVAALLFGSSQLPKLARSLGSAKKEFEKGLEEGHVADDETKADTKTDTKADTKDDTKA
jgi:sec-independent protein translocase protein TatA